MKSTTSLYTPDGFSEVLFEKMKSINTAVAELDLYEFRYALMTLTPPGGDWNSIEVIPVEELERKIHSLDFFESIQIKPKEAGNIVLDSQIRDLTNMLFVGITNGTYPVEWVRKQFAFDVRGFNFLVRSVYLTPEVINHLGGSPYKVFVQKQFELERLQEIGYKDFENANQEVDGFFIDSVMKLIRSKGTPILLAIAGPTAAGKTEIVERLTFAIKGEGKSISSVEMDNFLTDREQREARGIGSLGREALHFALFTRSLHEICQGKKISIPRYDFIDGTSSHDLDGNLKPGRKAVEIEPADIIFVEGNSPFLFEEVADLIGIKVVYITEDSVRLKRKWRRDIDLRKKYDPFYLRNRFFKEQFIMSVKCYQPQLQKCDIYVDTTGAAIWVTPEVAKILDH